MSQFRYPGTKPFTKNEKHLFFGRKDDIEQLYNLISLEQLVVLFGKSGLGKSSLINAGVSHLFEENNYTSIFIRFGNKPADNSDTIESIFLQRTALESAAENYLDKIVSNKNSFWYTFKSRQISDKNNKQYLIVFDQFEELFTFPDEIENFSNSLAELLSPNIPDDYRVALRQKMKEDKNFLTDAELDQLYEPLNIKILISIRSDRLSLLNRLSPRLPGILQRCYELMPLSPEMAMNAIEIPAKLKGHFSSPKFYFSPSLLNFILDYLSDRRTSSIESFQLQLVCEFFERQAIALASNNEPDFIQFDDGEGIRIIIREINEKFYNNIIDSFPQEDHAKISVFIEEGLILEEEERRISLYKGQIIKKFDINEELLNELVDKRIIRSENNASNLPYYELSHDTLIQPILTAKKRRIQKEEKERLTRELDEKRKIDAEINTLQKARELNLLDKKAFRIYETESLKKRMNLYFNQAKLKSISNGIRSAWLGIVIILFGVFCTVWSIVATYKFIDKANIIKRNSVRIEKSNQTFQGFINSYDSVSNPTEYKKLKELYSQYKDLQQ